MDSITYHYYSKRPFEENHKTQYILVNLNHKLMRLCLNLISLRLNFISSCLKHSFLFHVIVFASKATAYFSFTIINTGFCSSEVYWIFFLISSIASGACSLQ